MTPAPSMLYGSFIISLMAFPDEFDKEVADWITGDLSMLERTFDLNKLNKSALEKSLTTSDPSEYEQVAVELIYSSPTSALEAARRYVNFDIDKAMYWYVVGTTKMRYLIEANGGYGGGMGDILTVWRPYAFASISKKVNDQYLLLEKYHIAIDHLLGNWDRHIPLLSGIDPDKNAKRVEVRVGLKERLVAQLKKHRSKTEKQKRDEVAIFDVETDKLLAALQGGKSSSELGLKPETFDVVGKRNKTPLTWAMGKDDLHLFRALLESGANPNFKREKSGSPVSSAAKHDNIEYLRALLKNGGDPKSLNRFGKSALVVAINRRNAEHIKLLLSAGAPVDYPGEDQFQSPVMTAAQSGQFEQVMILLEMGADFRFVSKNGQTLGHKIEQAKRGDAGWKKQATKFLVSKGIDMPLPKIPRRPFKRAKDYVNKLAEYKTAVEEYNRIIIQKIGPEARISVE